MPSVGVQTDDERNRKGCSNFIELPYELKEMIFKMAVEDCVAVQDCVADKIPSVSKPGRSARSDRLTILLEEKEKKQKLKYEAIENSLVRANKTKLKIENIWNVGHCFRTSEMLQANFFATNRWIKAFEAKTFKKINMCFKTSKKTVTSLRLELYEVVIARVDLYTKGKYIDYMVKGDRELDYKSFINGLLKEIEEKEPKVFLSFFKKIFKLRAQHTAWSSENPCPSLEQGFKYLDRKEFINDKKVVKRVAKLIKEASYGYKGVVKNQEFLWYDLMNKLKSDLSDEEFDIPINMISDFWFVPEKEMAKRLNEVFQAFKEKNQTLSMDWQEEFLYQIKKFSHLTNEEKNTLTLKFLDISE